MPCECHTSTCERVRTARLTCASAALRGASCGCARSVVNLHVARPVLVNTMTTAFDGSGNAVRRAPPTCDMCAFLYRLDLGLRKSDMSLLTEDGLGEIK